MDISYLREFILLAECGNYHNAADELYISQSSLSKHIQLLEKDLNCTLFERTSKGISLTEQGRRFLAHCNRIVQAEDRCRIEMKQDAAGADNCIYVASEYRRLTRFISGFMEKYGNRYVINLQIGGSRSAKEALRKNMVELGIAKAFHADDSDLFYIPFGEEHLYAMVPVENPIAKKKFVRIPELAGERFIMQPRNSSHTMNCVRVCQQMGFVPDVAAYVDDDYNIYGLVRENFGVSLLYMDEGSFAERPDVVLVPVEPKTVVKGAVCYRKDVDLSPGAALLLEYARDCNNRAL